MEEKLISASLEDYLEALYEINEENQGVKAVDISKRLDVKRSSVTEAFKKLSTMGLLNYGPYQVISLTNKGEKEAQKVIKKHRTLYTFLNEILGVEKNIAEKTACKIEHVISEDVLERLRIFEICYKEISNNNLEKLYKKRLKSGKDSQ